MKKGSPLLRTPPRRSYASKGVSSDARELVAQYAQSARDSGTPLAAFAKIGEKTDYAPSKRTLQRHVAALDAGTTPLSHEKASGASKSLTDEQCEVLFGWVLWSPKKVDLDALIATSARFFGVSISKPTASCYCTAGELSTQLTGKRPMPKKLSRDEYVLGYHEYVLDRHNDGFLSIDPSKLACADFFTDSHRTERDTTLNGKGLPQKKIAGHSWLYTSNFLTVIWADGINRTPCLLFTYNPWFDSNGPHAEEVMKWCKDFRIARDRIYYVKSSKHYCKEVNAQTSEFCRRYKDQLKGTHVMHDGGNSFKIKKNLVFEEHCRRVSVMPSAQHGEISTCDNRNNALIKAKGKSMRSKDGNEAYNALALMYAADISHPAAIKRMFARNLFLDTPLNLEAVDKLLTKGEHLDPHREKLFDGYLAAFLDFVAENGDNILEDPPEADEDRLDGSYWRI